MKFPSLLTLGALALAAASCGSLNRFKQPLSDDGGFDPLASPTSSNNNRGSAVVAPTSPSYKVGQWVETSMPNATFFRAIPKGNASADKVLSVGTPLKVVSSKSTYVKVELDSGEVGYVPEIMVIERGAGEQTAAEVPPAPAPDYGPVPPPVEPGSNEGEIAPPPEVPDTPPPVPTIPGIPDVPAVPDIPAGPAVPTVPAPDLPGGVPSVPDIAPPPEIPGITDPVDIQ